MMLNIKIIIPLMIIIAINFGNSSLNLSKQKPNIIIFLADDLGWNDIGFHLSKHISTPNIDSLAANGIILNRYYTQPLCSPSRGALMTGIHPIHTGLEHYVVPAASPLNLPLELKILPQFLKDNGYSTHAFGKWHLGFSRKQYLPTFRGFDSHDGYWNGGCDYFNHSYVERGWIGLDFRHNLDVISNMTGIYTTEYITDRAVDRISIHNKCQPLFLYMAYPNVHAGNPYDKFQAPQRLINKFRYIKNQNRRIFAANVYSMDESFGRIVKELHNKKLLNNSIIIFLSDNGAAISGIHENEGSNYPLRGTKGTLWEGGIRVPAFIWSPLLKNSGYVSNNKIQVMDILPTILEAINDRSVEKIGYCLDGIPFWNILSKREYSKRNELLLNIDYVWNTSAIIYDNWKLIQGTLPQKVSPKPSDWSPSYENSDYENQTLVQQMKDERINSKVFKVLAKLKRHPNFDIFEKTVIDCGIYNKNNSTKCDLTQELCLFDISCDSCEFNNLAKKYPKIVKKLWSKIVRYNATTVKALSLTPLDPNANPIYHNNTWDVWIQ